MTKSNVTLKDIYSAVENLRDEVRESYVTKAEFEPVRTIAYGMVGLILVSVIGALVATVVRAFN